ncbi:MAG: gliding motility lipoprotein GldH [Bacteroidetes bacterium]|nr:gliding motility lipoprotein GldH [Bacteroidota bacterium]MBL6943619.1 gliding motility lipoprotein GldH [Bacteroidales bacterium]
MLKETVNFFISLSIISAIFSSCNSNTVYNQNVTLPSEGWFKNKAVAFNVNIYDTVNTYKFGLNIRNTINYRYCNLYVFLITEFPNGKIIRDTIECLLANHEGKWLGKGWGQIKENNIILKSDLRFPISGTYKFLIQQAMRVDTLTGINDIGLSVIKVGTNN